MLEGRAMLKDKLMVRSNSTENQGSSNLGISIY